jgi:hypothetical protein
MNEPAPVTTRVGGGLSARAAIVVLSVALAGIGGAAFVNRPPPPQLGTQVVVPPAPTPNGAAVLRSASPTHRASDDRLRPGDDLFAAIAIIGRRQYPILLGPDGGAGLLGGPMRVPIPGPDLRGTLELAQLWDVGPGRNFQSIGRWTLPLGPLTSNADGSGTVLIIEQAQPQAGANRLVRQGFQMLVRAERVDNYIELFVDVTTPFCGAVDVSSCRTPTPHSPYRDILRYRPDAPRGSMNR